MHGFDKKRVARFATEQDTVDAITAIGKTTITSHVYVPMYSGSEKVWIIRVEDVQGNSHGYIYTT